MQQNAKMPSVGSSIKTLGFANGKCSRTSRHLSAVFAREYKNQIGKAIMKETNWVLPEANVKIWKLLECRRSIMKPSDQKPRCERNNGNGMGKSIWKRIFGSWIGQKKLCTVMVFT